MADEMIFDYFYGQEADMFSFYRIPRIIIKDAHFAGLSSDAKILYGLALDRMSMSVKNGWQDENDRTFIFYTVENVMEDLNCSRKKAISFRKELEDFGLIERIRRGQGKPDLIYVKNFLGIHRVKNEDDFDSEMDNKAKKTDKKSASNPHKHSEVPKLHFKKCQNDTSRDVESAPQEVSETHFKKCQNDTSRSTESAPQEVLEMHPNYNNNNYNQQSYNNPITLSYEGSYPQSPNNTYLTERKKEASIPTVSLDPDFRLWEYKLESVKEYLYVNNGLSKDIVKDPEGLKFVILYLVNWDENIEKDSDLFTDTYTLAVEALIEMILTKTPQVYDRQEVNGYDVINRFNYLYRKQEFMHSMEGLIHGCVERYTRASQDYARNDDKIRNPKSYMKSTVWNTLSTYNLDFNTEVSKMSSCWN